jgi:dihydroflavonol-4-reductase
MTGPVLVTGGTGFVGAALVRALLGAGEAVRVLVRSGSDQRNLAGLDIETVTGDLINPAALADAVAGCRAVFHAAADYRLFVPDPARMYAVNVEGTRALLRAAMAAGVQRIVYTSSVATLGTDPSGAPADEHTPVALKDMVGHYKRSKFLAEQAVAKLVTEQAAPVVIVNPSTPIGPRDIKPTPTGQILVDAARGRIPAFVDTGLNVVHVDDVAQGHLLAWQRGRIGERYILGGEDMTLQAILAEVAAVVGRRPPRVRLPHWGVLPIAYLVEGAARALGRTPPVTVDSVRMAKKHMYFTSARAARELCYRWRAPTQAIRDALIWFKEQDYF